MNNTFPKPRILIVEDETIVAMDIERGLKSLDYDVVGTASSGQEAIEMVANFRPDVALMDIRLKGPMDGIEAARTIRKRFGVPIVFLTAHADASTVDRAKAAEPFGYLLKPFEDTELHTTLEIALHKKALEEIATHEAHEALHLSEQRFRLLVDSLQDYAVFLLDLQGRIISWNPGAERISGYSDKEVIGAHFSLFYPPDDIIANRPEKILRAAARENRTGDEGWRLRKDGSLFWADIIVTALHDGHGKLVGFAQITRDITERKHSEEQIRELNSTLEKRVQERTAELNAANQELEAFAYSVAHDLRAPLRGLRGYLSVLREELGEGLSIGALDYLGRGTVCAERMSKLVDDLLSFSRVNRQELETETLPVESLVREVIEELQTETAGRDIQWQIDPLPVLNCDPALVKQVFVNLLSNAVKYTIPRGRAFIHIGHTEEEGQVALFVRDNGVGFDMSHAHKLFQPFSRLHPGDRFQGSGVGLATVDRIVRRHGGRAWARAEVDKGACIYFTLGPHALVNPENSAPGLPGAYGESPLL